VTAQHQQPPQTSPQPAAPAPRRRGTSYGRRVLGYVQPYRGLVAATFAIIVLGAAFSLVAPWPMKIMLDYVIGGKPVPDWLHDLFGRAANNRKTLLLAVTLCMVAVTLLENLMSVVNNWVTTKLDQRMVLDFRGDLFAHAQRLSLAFHDQKRSGPLIYAINCQANAAAAIVLATPPILESLLLLVGMVGISFAINWKLASLALAVAPFL